jgi:hypothetical protein
MLVIVFAATLQAQAQVFSPYNSPAEYDEFRSLDEALKELSAQFRERRRVHRKLHGELLHAPRV